MSRRSQAFLGRAVASWLSNVHFHFSISHDFRRRAWADRQIRDRYRVFAQSVDTYSLPQITLPPMTRCFPLA